jgi:hypothetical protein
MKLVKLTTALTAMFLLASTAHAHGNYNKYKQNKRSYNNSNVVAGAVIGGLVGAVMYNTFQPRRVYVYPQPVYVQPPPAIVLVPSAPYSYYAEPRSCQTVRIPVYDAGGRLIQYVQQCVN